RSIASQSGGEGEVSSSSIESSIKDRALRSASERMNEMNRSTSDEAPVRDRAAEFMNNYNAFQDEMAKTISTSSPSESSTESVSIVNQEQLEAAQSEKERYDRLIADLEARLSESEDIIRKLTAEGVNEIKTADGEVITKDAFEETNRQIEAQRERAQEERDRIERDIQRAQEVLANSNRSNSFGGQNSGVVS